VATAKIHFEEEALVAGTKQSSLADKAGWPTRQSGIVLGTSFWCFLIQVDFVLTDMP